MRHLFFLFFNLLLIAFALTTGAFLLIVAAVVVTAWLAYIFVRQKLGGKPPSFHVYRYRSETAEEDIVRPSSRPGQPPVIEVEYREVSKTGTD